MKRKNQKFSTPAFVCGEIGLVHSLGLLGIPVYLGSEFAENVALYSRFVDKKIRMPSYDSDDFVVKLLEFGHSLPGKPVLLTDDDEAVLAISRNREALQELYRFLLPPPEIVEQIQDKRKFYSVAETHNLPIPDSHTVSSSDELKKIRSKLSFPCILKPAGTKDWQNGNFNRIMGPYRKAITCASIEELESIYEKISQVHPTVILQKYVEGRDHSHYSVNMYLNAQGDLKGYYIYRKLRMYPVGAGRGSFFVTIFNREIFDKALDAAVKFGMRGLTNIQFKEDRRTGTLKLIEMEARLSISSFLGPASGMNLAFRYYNDLVSGEKETSSDNEYHTGIRFSDPFKDFMAFSEYWKRSELSFLEWIRSYMVKCVFNGCLFSDPRPILQNLWFMLRRRLKKERREPSSI